MAGNPSCLVWKWVEKRLHKQDVFFSVLGLVGRGGGGEGLAKSFHRTKDFFDRAA